MDQYLARWTHISIQQYFKTIAAGIPLPLFVEGFDERTEATQRVNHAELRLTGPNVSNPSSNYWTVEAEVNILLHDYMESASADVYSILRWSGIFQDAMLDPIPIYKRGPDAGDDDSLIGCLVARNREPKAVMVYHFGQMDKDDRLRQSEIDCLYKLDITS